MIIIGPQNSLEVAAVKLGLQAEDELQVCLHPFVFGRILPVDMAGH